jgi:DNA-directed RNA polymerase specialized sigma24 family protein
MGGTDGHDLLADRLEAHRGQPQAMAYRMPGSMSEADDSVQETLLGGSTAGVGRTRRPADGDGQPGTPSSLNT